MRQAVLAWLVLFTASGAAAQAPPPALVHLATAWEYPGETYTDGPTLPAQFVYFSGETIAVDVRLANWGTQPIEVRPGTDVAAFLSTTLTSGGETLPARIRWTDLMWQDVVAGSLRGVPQARVRLDPGDAVRWRALIETPPLAPGLYTVRTRIDQRVSGGLGIRSEQPDLVIEIRARDAAQPAELARRAAEWLAAEGTPAEARAATVALERVYPDSVAVHLIRSRLAEAEGDQTGARRELDAALEFMRQDRDHLFRRYARPGQIEDLIDSLLP